MQIENMTAKDGKSYQVANGNYYHAETPREVISWLETSRERRQRIRIFYGDGKTGESWNEENDVAGHIGRSMGPIRIPLMIANARSMGGPGILDHCIVAIATRGSDGKTRFVYRHPTFKLGDWQGKPCEDSEMLAKGYTFEAFRDGELQARFKTQDSAMRYLAFMRGERMAK